MKHRISIVVVLAMAATGTVVFAFRSNTPPVQPVLLPRSANALTAVIPSETVGLAEPVPQFKDRVTMKTFGLYVTIENSPVPNDRFIGYHAGVDAEYTDTVAEVPVFAISDGTVTLARWVNGYGGVIVIQHILNGAPVYALYGHLDVKSFTVAVQSTVTRGERIGYLGDDHSQETDGVRKHLHFSLYTGETMDVRGYVLTKAELAPWMDPLSVF